MKTSNLAELVRTGMTLDRVLGDAIAKLQSGECTLSSDESDALLRCVDALAPFAQAVHCAESGWGQMTDDFDVTTVTLAHDAQMRSYLFASHFIEAMRAIHGSATTNLYRNLQCKLDYNDYVSAVRGART